MPDGTSSSLSQVKISELPVAPAVNDADQLEANQAGTSRSITVAQVKAAAVAAVPVPPAITDVSPRSFGAVGDGVTDDTAALQAACNAVAAMGGGRVNCAGGRWLIDSAHLLLAHNVILVGPWLMPGMGIRGAMGNDYSGFTSIILLNPLYTIKFVGHSAGVEGLAVFNKNVFNNPPPTTLRGNLDRVKLFGGVGITIGDGTGYTAEDGSIRNVMVAGFQTGISINFAARSRIDQIFGDNSNGLYITKCYDMDYISNVHFWPFLTPSGGAGALATYTVAGAANNGAGLIRITTTTPHILATGDTSIVVRAVGGVPNAIGTWTVTVIDSTTFDLVGSTFAGAYTTGGTVDVLAFKRSGIGIHCDVDTDWAQLTNCFCYSYQTAGIKITDSDNATLINCGCDNYAPTGDTVPIGIHIAATSYAAALIGCKTAAQGTGLRIETSAPNLDSIAVTNHRAWGNVQYGIYVADGSALFANLQALTGSVIRVGAAAGPVKFTGGDLTGVTFSYESAASPRPSFVNVRGTVAEIAVATSGASGSRQVTRFDGYNSAPANNDSIFEGYFLTDDAGAQREVFRQTVRLDTVAAATPTARVFWALINAGTFTNTLTYTTSIFSPLVNDGLALGAVTTAWSDLFLASGGVINWNNGAYTLTHSSTNLLLSGGLQVGTLGSSNALTVRGTDNANGLLVLGTAGTKFFVVKPEAATDTCQYGYWTGAAYGNLDLKGTLRFADATPVTLPATAIAAGSATQAFIKASSTANLGIYYGTGVPSFSAAKGSIYTCTNATTTTTRLYVNTDGATTWATITTSA